MLTLEEDRSIEFALTTTVWLISHMYSIFFEVKFHLLNVEASF